MCVARPVRIVAIDAPSGVGTVDASGVEQTVNLAMTPEAAVGDWVLTHSGVAFRKLDPETAVETLALFESER